MSSKSFQIRPIVDFDRPDLYAIEARDQCVAFLGVCSEVATITSSTRSSGMDAGRPGRASSSNASSLSVTNRARHRLTVCGATRNRAATSLFDKPSAQANTIRAHSATACADLARLAIRSNSERSSSVRISSAFGLPVRGTPHHASVVGAVAAEVLALPGRMALF